MIILFVQVLLYKIFLIFMFEKKSYDQYTKIIIYYLFFSLFLRLAINNISYNIILFERVLQ